MNETERDTGTPLAAAQRAFGEAKQRTGDGDGVGSLEAAVEAAIAVERSNTQSAYDTLRSKLEAEVERLREREKNYEAEADRAASEKYRDAARRLAAEQRYYVDRLQAILSDVETGKAENPVKRP